MKKVNLKCPFCGKINPVEMPKNSCLAFHVCQHCNKTISAKKECCVICEFSDEKCEASTK